VPLPAVSSSPTATVPVIAGLAVLVGAPVDETIALGLELALAEPSAFVAVTTARTRWSTSAATSV
jgi:hypothetical protein